MESTKTEFNNGAHLNSDGYSDIEWLASQGGKFIGVNKWDAVDPETGESIGKSPLGKRWQKRPHGLDVAKRFLSKGFNTGMLTGETSDGICVLDIDKDLFELLGAFPQIREWPYSDRNNDPNRCKFFVKPINNPLWTSRVGEREEKTPDGRKIKVPLGIEWLANGRQAVVPPSRHPSGVYLQAHNFNGTGIPEVPFELINEIWKHRTGVDMYTEEEIKKGKDGNDDSNKDDEWTGDLSDAMYWLAKYSPKGTLGNRNKTGEELARQLFNSRVPLETAKFVMAAYADSRDHSKSAAEYNVVDAFATLRGVYASKQRDKASTEHLYRESKGRTTMEDVMKQVSTTEWAWKKWLPYGMLTMVAGPVEGGKSWLVLCIARSFITGCAWPDGTPFEGETGSVLWIDTEASESLTGTRIKLLGMPLDKFVVPGNWEKDVNLANKNDQAAILSLAMDPDIKLVVIDSLRGAHRKDELDSATYFIEHELAKIARDTGKPIIVTQVLRKLPRGIAIDEITVDDIRGNSALVQSTRVVIAVLYPDKALPDHVVVQVKNNLGEKGKNLGLILNPKTNEVRFTDAPVVGVAKEEKATDAARARRLLVELMRERGGEILYDDVLEIGKKIGLGYQTLNKARERVGFDSGTPHKDEGDNRRYWYMPYKVGGINRNGHSEGEA